MLLLQDKLFSGSQHQVPLSCSLIVCRLIVSGRSFALFCFVVSLFLFLAFPPLLPHFFLAALRLSGA